MWSGFDCNPAQDATYTDVAAANDCVLGTYGGLQTLMGYKTVSSAAATAYNPTNAGATAFSLINYIAFSLPGGGPTRPPGGMLLMRVG
jgi:hypothetical protein